jgi:acyl-coenzyme A synthetase/AMP-(fatty) acid ligase
MPESNNGEHLTEIIAYVSLKPDFEKSADLKESIRKLAKAQLPHFKAPKKIYFLATLPRTPTGKIHRQSLRQTTNI